jgi:hypothetical protein
MHFTKPVTIFISGELASPMVDMLVFVSPGSQTGINAVFVCVNQGA